MDLRSCAITGHRPTRFKWKYKENTSGCKHLKKQIREQCALLYENGVRQFWVGGSLGVDMWAAELLLKLKKEPDYSGIELMIALPFENHDSDWDDRSKLRMTFLMQHSTATVTVGKADKSPAVNYRKRNEYLVAQADCLLAIYDNDHTFRSGTGMTVNYAKKKGIPIIYIHPDTGIVSQ